MNWKTLQILNSLYQNIEIESKYLISQSYGKTLIETGLINSDGKTKLENFDMFFEKKWLADYAKVNKFMSKFDLLQYNFELEHINSLQRIEKDKDELIEKGTSLKEISTTYFGSAKKVKEKSQLYKAMLSILYVSSLKRDEHDQQYLWILHAENRLPKAIVLCENDNLLKKSRLYDIELWYAGGNNTAKLKYIPEPKLPYYYLCDLDNNGIEIYQRIKKNYFSNINLIIPDSPLLKDIEEDKKWSVNIDCGLFTEQALILINELKKENKWIEEESISLNL